MVIENPILIVYKHPLMPLATSLAKGAIWSVVGAYYDNGCPYISDEDIKNIAALPGGDWQRHGDRIIMTLREILPLVQKQYEIKQRKLEVKQKLALYARAGADAKRALKQRAIKNLSDDLSSHTGNFVIPPPHIFQNQDKFDHHKRDAALASNKTKSTKLLTDK